MVVEVFMAWKQKSISMPAISRTASILFKDLIKTDCRPPAHTKKLNWKNHARYLDNSPLLGLCPIRNISQAPLAGRLPFLKQTAPSTISRHRRFRPSKNLFNPALRWRLPDHLPAVGHLVSPRKKYHPMPNIPSFAETTRRIDLISMKPRKAPRAASQDMNRTRRLCASMHETF